MTLWRSPPHEEHPPPACVYLEWKGIGSYWLYSFLAIVPTSLITMAIPGLSPGSLLLALHFPVFFIVHRVFPDVPWLLRGSWWLSRVGFSLSIIIALSPYWRTMAISMAPHVPLEQLETTSSLNVCIQMVRNCYR